MDLFHAVVCNVEVTFGVEAHTIGLVVFPFSAGIFGEVCEDFHGADFPLCNHGKFENSVELAFADEKSFAVEVLFINGRQLIELATSHAREFRQESVLEKDNATNEIYLVDGN